ncbi:PLP-dependent aminotransferase family protein [Paraburkholderia azotifigens]|uniref:PLP-dependent aminotransferase family protein n=1 Tax=Paraburkholderia azotifigens TaxID=2057004 RepID=A0A5C6V5B2_9BURK|nr:PLP-dependent aminotransferase family protein [Paraburkholderia azotifigens]TXC79038.1 PLP-dependent aminotransferase family protein [Paraburkholderia azotifigens]
MICTKTGTLSAPDATSKEPFYRQVYVRFRNAIADGRLAPGDRVPSARALATELGLSRGTVEAAYSTLIAEGYFQPRGQAGTFVAPGIKPPLSAPATPGDPGDPLAYAPGTLNIRPVSLLPLQMGIPALDAFPRRLWTRLGARCIRAAQIADMAYPAAHGLAALRTAIATYLQLARGIDCSPSQIFVTSGYRNTLELIVHALLKPDDCVWVEDPGFPPTRLLLQCTNISPAPVPVDEEGMIVAQGIATASHARAAIVTPAHQSPLCMSLSLPRRLALLEWASQNKAWIVEDDYDGEYRYVSRPLPALKSLDRHGRVLYAGTFSKVLFPGIRLAYLVVPKTEIERFEYVSQIFSGGGPQLTQAIVTEFLTEGHFARHIQRMRKLYGERRKAAATGLERILGAHMRIEPQPGGMHLVLRMRRGGSDRSLAERIRSHGMYAQALSDWSIGRQVEPALLLGFTNIDSESTAEKFGRRILKLM